MNPNNTTYNANPGNQGTIEATFTFPEISNLIKKMFAETLPQVPLDAKPLFIFKSIPQGMGDSIQVNEQDYTTYAADMPEGVNAAKGQFGVGFHKQVLWHRYGLEMDITYKMRTTAMWLDIVSATVKALSQAVPQRENLDMTHMLTFGNAVSYVDMDGFVRDTSTGDGLSLFNAAHLLAFVPQTYSNIVPGNPQFTKTALESAELLTKTDILDNFGKLRRMPFKTIWCSDTPNLTNSIMQYIRSVSDPVQANPGVENPYKGKYDILPLSLLATDANGIYDGTKQNWWGIAALAGSGGERWQAYRVQWEAPRLITSPSAGNNGEDRHNDNWNYGVRGSENYAALSGRGIIASLAVNS
jgi:hypothetical protein